MASSSAGKNFLEKAAPFLLVVSLGLAFFAGNLWQKEKGRSKTQEEVTTAQGTSPQKPNITIGQVKDVFGKSVIKFGNGNSKVVFLEISDPSCPYCNVAAGKNPELNRQIDPTNNAFKLVSDGGKYVPPVPEMRKLAEEGKALYSIIYFPGHGNGELAMKALYCAYDMGKYWQVHDLLMSKKGYDLINNEVKNDMGKSGVLVDFLKSAVDSNKLKECLDSGKYNDRLAQDQELASSLGSQGTPNFFVNENNFAGAYSFVDIKPAVDEALK